MKKDKALIFELVEMVESEHGNCDSQTCMGSNAIRHGFNLIAIDWWASSGAASDEFYAVRTKLPKKYKGLGSEWKKECDGFNKIPSIECGCGAHVYDPKDCGFHCDNCGRSVKEKESA